MNEHSFIRSVHRQLPDSLYKWKINDPYQGGVADCYYSGNFADMWLEYKYIKALPKRPETLIRTGLTTQQSLWLNQRHAEGRHVGVVVGSPSGHCILVANEWDRPLSMGEFIRSAVVTKEIVAYIVKHTTTLDARDTYAEHFCPRPGKCSAAQRDMESKEG